MTYLCWAVMYEGSSDAAYFDVLLPRVMENLIQTEGERPSDVPTAPSSRLGIGNRDVEAVAAAACAEKAAFHLIFIHADTGGRRLQSGIASRSISYCRAMHNICEWPPSRCVVIAPRHETEAWILSDPAAVTGALGYSGLYSEVGLPSNAQQAERLPDPKSVLMSAVTQVRGRRKQVYPEQIYPAIAQRQSLAMLRQSESFMAFENNLREALRDLGTIRT